MRVNLKRVNLGFCTFRNSNYENLSSLKNPENCVSTVVLGNILFEMLTKSEFFENTKKVKKNISGYTTHYTYRWVRFLSLKIPLGT